MSLGRKVLGNSLSQLVGKVITTVTSIVLVAFITRSLGVADYGSYVTVLAYTQLFGIFADLGVNLYMIKRLAAEPAGDEQTRAMYGLRLVTTLAVILIGILGAFITPYSHEVRLAIVIGMIAIGAQSINSLGVSILQARLKMVPAVVSEVVGRLVVLALTFFAVQANLGLYGVIGAVTIGGLLNMALTFRASNRYLRAVFAWQPAVWRTILIASLPISLTAILSFLYFKSDTVLLSVLPLHGGRSNEVEVGIYGAAYKVLEMVQLVPGIILGNVFPIISEFWAKKDERLPGLLQKVFDNMAVFGVLVSLVAIVLAKPIMVFVAGESFGVSALPLQVLAGSILLNYFTSMYAYTALALDEQRALAKVYAWSAAFNIVTNLIFIPQYSYMAAAVTTLLTQVVVLVGVYRICQHRLTIGLNLRIVALLLPVTIISGVVLWSLRSFHVLLAAVIGTVVFLAAAVVFKAMQPKELLKLARRSA